MTGRMDRQTQGDDGMEDTPDRAGMRTDRVPVLTLRGLIWIHAGLALFMVLMAMWADHLPD
ncbi:hypothetical protein CFR76_05105 [Komagataeibacter swingsii]|uniref:Uncharacterized protein n=1 Tax=Komagataeibacter swingsii TaxID=215220 RepID=A0A2V4RKH9_9PROT|nr:hypothetical protein CFR76_05105 [Komagataeibacter swingsii]GBQ60106.1 hypothetical protein AA16373_1770 [Komagataeibacter swingsii DSM 16373]